MASIKKNFLYNATLNVVNVLFPVITIPYVSRVLGVEQIGVFSFVVAIVSYFSLFAALGMPLYGTREIAKTVGDHLKVNKLFNELFSINVLSSAFFTAVFLISINVIPVFIENKTNLFISGISLYFCALNIDWFYSGIENFKLITFRSIVVKVLMMISLFLFVRTKNDLSIYILLNALSLLGNQVWNVLALRYAGFNIKITFHSLRKHLKSLCVLLFSAIAMQVYLMIDTVMLGFMSNYEEVGLYSSAIKSVRIVMPVTIALSVVLLPRLSFLKEHGSTEEASSLLNKAFDIIMLFSIPLAFFFFSISDKFVPFFFGQEYIGAITPMKICSLLIWMGNMSYFASVQILAMYSFEKEFLLSTIAGMLFNIIGNFCLISTYGAIGASTASFIGELSVTTVAFLFIYKNKLFKIRWKYLFRCLIASLPFTIISKLMTGMDLQPFNWLVLFSFLSWCVYFLVQLFVFRNSYCRNIISFNLMKK